MGSLTFVEMLLTTASASSAENNTATAEVAAVTSAVASSPPPPSAPRRRPTACTTGTSCVSTASFKSPANFLPPWEYGPRESDDEAFANLTRLLLDRPGTVLTATDEAAGYLAARLQYRDGTDDVEFFFIRDGSKTVLFKSQSQVNKALPPGCFTPGCINGPRNRGRLEELQREIGWLPLETDEDKKWVPLLLH